MNGENLIGLVMIGGKSSRMGSDKSLLIYTGKTQRETVFKMLGECAGAFGLCGGEK